MAIPILPWTKTVNYLNSPLHRRFAELDWRDIGENGAQTAEGRPDRVGKVDFLEHCFTASGVLFFGSSEITSPPGRNDP
jgi:hypothetical protein